MRIPKLFNSITRAYGSLPRLLPGGRALPPLHLIIEVTYRCNLSCSMCQFFSYLEDGEGRKKDSPELSFDEIKGVVEGLPIYTIFTFSGGELFVRKDTMEILSWMSSKRRLSIVTNGTLIDADRAKALVAMAPRRLTGRGLLLVDVSLEGIGWLHDGIAGVPGSFDRTVAALAALSEEKRRAGKKYPLINMKTVVSESNVSELGKLYDLARELDLDIFNPMVYSEIEAHTIRFTGKSRAEISCPPKMDHNVDTGALDEQLNMIAEKEKRHGRPQLRFTPPDLPASDILRYYRRELDIADYECMAPWSFGVLSAYGDVLVCPYIMVGNIREKPFRDIWNGAEARAFRTALKNKGIFEGCMGCCSMTPKHRA